MPQAAASIFFGQPSNPLSTGTSIFTSQSSASAGASINFSSAAAKGSIIGWDNSKKEDSSSEEDESDK